MRTPNIEDGPSEFYLSSFLLVFGKVNAVKPPTANKTAIKIIGTEQFRSMRIPNMRFPNMAPIRLKTDWTPNAVLL